MSIKPVIPPDPPKPVIPPDPPKGKRSRARRALGYAALAALGFLGGLAAGSVILGCAWRPDVVRCEVVGAPAPVPREDGGAGQGGAGGAP